jgi:hypothetical protein
MVATLESFDLPATTDAHGVRIAGLPTSSERRIEHLRRRERWQLRADRREQHGLRFLLAR